MCEYVYQKMNAKTNKMMYYCLLKNNFEDEMKKLCVRQRYCNKDKAYVLNDTTKCLLNKNK